MKTELNKSYITNGNESIDLLLFKIESLDLLSINFKQRITSTALHILQAFKTVTKADYKKIGDELEDEVNEQHKLLKKVNILSDDFIYEVSDLLTKGIYFEKDKIRRGNE